MAGHELVGENPLRYADAETGVKLEVRSIVDSETGKEVYVVFGNDNTMSVVQIHGDSFKTTAWKRALKVDEDSLASRISKHCDVTEKARIEGITDIVSLAGTP